MRHVFYIAMGNVGICISELSIPLKNITFRIVTDFGLGPEIKIPFLIQETKIISDQIVLELELAEKIEETLK